MSRLEKGKEMAFLGSRLKLSPNFMPFIKRDQRQELEIQPHGVLLLPTEVRSEMSTIFLEV